RFHAVNPFELRSVVGILAPFLDSTGIFFFASRRRHTIWPRDWSSDVCSSDLCPARALAGARAADDQLRHGVLGRHARGDLRAGRSEERRVGKECRCWWWMWA